MIASHTKEDINILCLSGNAYTIASAELVEKQYNTLYVKYKYNFYLKNPYTCRKCRYVDFLFD